MKRLRFDFLFGNFSYRPYYRSSREYDRKWRSRWEGISQRPISHYIGFAAGGSLMAYAICAIIDVERDKRRRDRWLSLQQSALDKLSTVGSSSLMAMRERGGLLEQWIRLKESKRTILSIIAMNVMVFGAWHVPRVHHIMVRYFLHSTQSHPITMLTSIFSHRTLMHLSFNMLALYSFGTLLHDRIGREHFLAFYVSAGLGASLGSHLYKAWRGEAARSLGASGAIFGVAGAVASTIPNVNVSLIFLPFTSVSLDRALPAIMAFDLAGLVLRWQSFDHAAHLSGALLGYAIFPISQRILWANRRQVLQSLGYPVK